MDYLALSPRLVQARPRWQYTRASFLRSGVAERLVNAAEALPASFKLAVVEGWRPPYIQKRLYAAAWNRWRERHPDWSEVQLRRVVNRFTAPLHGRVPPPHSTGAALDVVLADGAGMELDHVSPYENFDPAAFLSDTKGLSDQASQNRAILFEALTKGGLTNYPSEWWHWSYGDQGWAYRTGSPVAIYGPTEPEGWTGVEEDMIEEPLSRAVDRR